MIGDRKKIQSILKADQNSTSSTSRLLVEQYIYNNINWDIILAHSTKKMLNYIILQDYDIKMGKCIGIHKGIKPYLSRNPKYSELWSPGVSVPTSFQL